MIFSALSTLASLVFVVIVAQVLLADNTAMGWAVALLVVFCLF